MARFNKKSSSEDGEVDLFNDDIWDKEDDVDLSEPKREKPMPEKVKKKEPDEEEEEVEEIEEEEADDDKNDDAEADDIGTEVEADADTEEKTEDEPEEEITEEPFKEKQTKFQKRIDGLVKKVYTATRAVEEKEQEVNKYKSDLETRDKIMSELLRDKTKLELEVSLSKLQNIYTEGGEPAAMAKAQAEYSQKLSEVQQAEQIFARLNGSNGQQAQQQYQQPQYQSQQQQQPARNAIGNDGRIDRGVAMSNLYANGKRDEADWLGGLDFLWGDNGAEYLHGMVKTADELEKTGKYKGFDSNLKRDVMRKMFEEFPEIQVNPRTAVNKVPARSVMPSTASQASSASRPQKGVFKMTQEHIKAIKDMGDDPSDPNVRKAWAKTFKETGV